MKIGAGEIKQEWCRTGSEKTCLGLAYQVLELRLKLLFLQQLFGFFYFAAAAGDINHGRNVGKIMLEELAGALICGYWNSDNI